ncbi:hypothetical protein STCU_10266 [Strigomonas culicis]|uniref:Uncharacterized protein n=1 Tax=Strigomonas culicis TaxID=28005 RepID=S9TNN7_9TRYP|nr:hypothetical protein STCU_10266 [Strigomonas culicis]|eukprot:EPY17998.1 hypothetical protein STCU_10266 [Strigomonas culicis]
MLPLFPPFFYAKVVLFRRACFFDLLFFQDCFFFFLFIPSFLLSFLFRLLLIRDVSLSLSVLLSSPSWRLCQKSYVLTLTFLFLFNMIGRRWT